MKKKERISFDEYYSALYGDRWQLIKDSFKMEKENINLSPRLLSPYYLDPASIMVASLLPVSKGDRILDMCAAPGGKTLSIALRLEGDGELISNDRSPDRAPCSSERHVFLDPKHLSIWSPSRPKRLAKEQYALLSSAFITLKKGGYLLYSTCSINPCENQDVISRLFDRHSDEVEEIETEIHAAEHMQHGLMIMPDRTDGLGPMYACLLRKKQ